MKDLLFRYELQDAWCMPVHGISVYDRTENNVEAVCWSLSPFSRHEPGANTYTIDRDSIIKISNSMANNIEVFEVKEVEMPFVIGGVINKFSFHLDDFENEVCAYNFWVFREEDAVTFEGTRSNADFVLKIFDEISIILIDNGIDSKYFELDIDD